MGAPVIGLVTPDGGVQRCTLHSSAGCRGEEQEEREGAEQEETWLIGSCNRAGRS